MRFSLSQIIIFASGMFGISFGVAVTAKALLGATPIAAIPFSLSQAIPFISFGIWVALFNILLVILEWFLLKGKIRFVILCAQASLALCLGSLVDLSMFLILDLEPHTYWQQILWVCTGSIILAISVTATIKSNVAVLPGDGFALAVASVTRLDFGRVRLYSDITMALTGLAICLVWVGDLNGVREGTIIASLLCGPCIKIFMNLSSKKLRKTK